MPSLAVIPGNTMDDLIDKGIGSKLASYYNPQKFFDKVMIFSSLEAVSREVSGMQVVAARDHELPIRLKEHGIDLVRGFGGALAADMAAFYRYNDVPVIVSVHDKRASMINRGVFYADVVFAVSEELKGILVARGVAQDRVMVVPNGVDGDLMRVLPAQMKSDLDQKYPFKYKILHVGRKSPEKNIEAIVCALARLGRDYGLVAIGQGDASFYEALALAQGVADRCVFLSGMPQEDLVRFYAWADCVCHPSRSEAMCNVLLEALACGKCVVATSTAARGLGDGPMKAMRLLINPEDIIALADELRRVCEDENVRGTLGGLARPSVEPYFLPLTQAHEVVCYKRVLSMKADGVFKRSWRAHANLWHANGMRRAGRLWRKICGL